MHESRQLSGAEAILEALGLAMKRDEKVYLIGEGVADPKGIFGTTTGLEKIFGSSRVIETPISENAITGIALGAAIKGLRPILTHQRVEFALLSMEQIINQLSKWHFMSAGHRCSKIL